MTRIPQQDDGNEPCGADDIPEPARVIERVLEMISGKWKVLIVMHLTAQKVCRFGELRRKLPNVTQRMLTLQLREMETDGLLSRHVYAEVPPRVEYTLTAQGRDLKSVYKAIHAWGLLYPDARSARTEALATTPSRAGARKAAKRSSGVASRRAGVKAG